MSDKPCPNCVLNFNCPTCNRATAEVERLRQLLREVMAAPCDTSGGEYASETVLLGMEWADRHWTDGEMVKPNADLLARVSAATKEVE